MTVTPKTLFGLDTLAASATRLYLCPASTKAQITTASFTNTDTSNRTFTIHIVRSGDSVMATNMVVDAQGLSTTENITPRALCGRNLGPGDSIWGLASVAAKINAVIDGFELTT